MSIAAAKAILVSMEGPAKKYVSPRAFDTTVPVRSSLLADIVSFNSKKAARPTKQQARSPLGCTQSLMTWIEPCKCFATLTLKADLLGT